VTFRNAGSEVKFWAETEGGHIRTNVSRTPRDAVSRRR
jgi:hypothetical protein